MDYPRVTEVLRAFTSYDQVPKDILERAAARGTSVHALCAAIAKGDWIPDTMIDKELRGYVNSFKQWAEAQVDKFVIIEKRLHDNLLQYSGQLDFVILGKDNELYLVDLKTSARPQKTYPVQMAAYDYLLRNNEVKVKTAMLVYLNKDGDFPEIHTLESMDREFQVFHSALDCYHYFNKGKKHAKTRTKSVTKRTPENSGDNVGSGLHTEG